MFPAILGERDMQAASHDIPCEDLRARLVTRFRGPLMSFFLRRTRDRAEAEDLAQETLTRIVGAAGIDGHGAVDSYVFKVAINLLRDRARKAARGGNPVLIPIDESTAAALEDQLQEQVTPERVLLGRESVAEALRVLDELGERTRNIFLLFRLESMKHKEIAALYGISVSTVEKHVMKAALHLGTRRVRT